MYESKYDEVYEKIKSAVLQTKGIVIVYENCIVRAPFCEISAGYTRNGKEAGLPKYLQSVESTQDLLSDGYICERKISQKKLPNFQIIEMDSVGYVTRIQYGEQYFTGEEFRKKMNFPSACFTFKKEKDNFIFTIKGAGHGFGYSKFGGNEMAKTGKTFIEILSYYYADIEIEKYE